MDAALDIVAVDQDRNPVAHPLDLAEQAGCDRGDLLAGTTLSDSGTARIGARVEDRDFIQVAQNALLLTGDAALGLQLGLRLNLSAHALLGQAFMTCRDLREAIELMHVRMTAVWEQELKDLVEQRTEEILSGRYVVTIDEATARFDTLR